jgi:hypothetical protein
LFSYFLLGFFLPPRAFLSFSEARDSCVTTFEPLKRSLENFKLFLSPSHTCQDVWPSSRSLEIPQSCPWL